MAICGQSVPTSAIINMPSVQAVGGENLFNFVTIIIFFLDSFSDLECHRHVKNSLFYHWSHHCQPFGHFYAVTPGEENGPELINQLMNHNSFTDLLINEKKTNRTDNKTLRVK